jgi:tripartite-type tricarboxylate transporter receptor subunit TctC
VFPAGSGADVYVRFFADQVKKVSGKTVIVENKSGAAGLVGIEYTARAKPDGYTILVHGATGVVNIPALYKNPPIDVTKDLEIVSSILRQPWMIIVDSKSPYQNIKQLTEAMLKKGDKSSYSVAATAGTVMGELYKAATGIKSVEVNYKTAQDSWNDMAAGRTDWGAHDPVASLAELRKGTMRILAVSTGQRVDSQPDIPTMTEQGVPMDMTLWWAAMVPAGVPEATKAQIREWFVKAVQDPETKKFVNQFGGDPLLEPVEESNKRWTRNIDEWKQWAKLAKIDPQ